MATFSKQILSGSTNGRGIGVTSTTQGAGTTVHATGTSASIYDEIWIYATNTTASAIVLTIEFGGTTAATDDIKVSVPSQSGLTLVCAGLILRGTGAAATTVTAFSATQPGIILYGYVNRIT
jgi:hypothetical protein